ncbi:MAG: hypothetical protein Q9184_003554 [Pyrenodesmia sp. 2 TL-2023]
MSWFWRGFQSAVFYYVSCAPCSQMAYRRRRRKGAARSRLGTPIEEGLYPHSSPFSTNVYWREEMALGPGPPLKKKDRERERQQRARGERTNRGSSRELVTGNSTDTGTSSVDTMVARSSLQGVAEMEQERKSEDGWNRRRYQREDEFLWGLDAGNRDRHAFSNQYCTVRNPEVNDLHPPVVSTAPTHRSETRWMVQPPPSAKVMEGKERANRSRSGSGGSNGSSRRGEMGLGRQIGERMVEEKRRKGKTTEPTVGSAAMSRDTSRESTLSNLPTTGQRHDRDGPIPPARIPTDTAFSTSSAAKAIPTDQQSPQPFTTAAATRPQLQPIISSTFISPAVSASTSPPSLPPRSKPQLHLRPPLFQTTSNSSLRALQELVSPATALNASPPSVTERTKLPFADDVDQELEIPEMESLWPPPGSSDGGPGDLGYDVMGVGVGGSRRERWSCDL